MAHGAIPMCVWLTNDTHNTTPGRVPTRPAASPAHSTIRSASGSIGTCGFHGLDNKSPKPV